MDVDAAGKLPGSKPLFAVEFPPAKQSNGTAIIIKKQLQKGTEKNKQQAKKHMWINTQVGQAKNTCGCRCCGQAAGQ